MAGAVLSDGGDARVCIAVAAEMGAGIVNADVVAEEARAALPRCRQARQAEAAAGGFFQHRLRHAASRVDAERREVVAFKAGAHLDAELAPDVCERLAERETLFCADLAQSGKIALRLLVEVNETHDAVLYRSRQFLCHAAKRPPVKVERVLLCDEYGIIAPMHGASANNARQGGKARDRRLDGRRLRLDILSVGRDRHAPELAKGCERVPVREKRRGILRAENDEINDGGIENIARDTLRIIGASRHDESFAQAPHEPLGIKGRDVRAASRIQNHGSPPSCKEAGRGRLPPGFSYTPLAQGLFNLVNPPLRRFDMPHLNARQGIIKLLDDGTHLLHAAGEADLPAVVVDLADGRDDGRRAAEAAFLEVRHFREQHFAFIHLETEIMLGDIGNGAARDRRQDARRLRHDEIAVRIDKDDVRAARLLDLRARRRIEVDVLGKALAVRRHDGMQAHRVVKPRLDVPRAVRRGAVEVADLDRNGLRSALEVRADGRDENAELVLVCRRNADDGA